MTHIATWRAVSPAAIVLALAVFPAPAGASPGQCEDLMQLKLTQAVVTGAAVHPAGVLTPPYGGGVPVVRPFCRVAIIANPTPASDIHMEVWLPLPSDWNGRFWGIGNTGYGGFIWHGKLGPAVAAGYAAVSSDAGHEGNRADKTWARGQPERVADFMHRSAHLSAVLGKAVAVAYYGRAPSRAYFSGFSSGGNEGLMLAQRYPEDYDGIIAGAPNQNWTNLYLGIANFQLVWLKDPARYVSAPQLAALHDAVIATCGASDGLIESPDRCDVEAALRTYKPNDAAPPLTAPQLASVRALYAGPVDVDGKRMHPGYAPGSEALWSAMHFGETPGRGPLVGYMAEFLANWVYDNAAWDYRTFDFGRDLALTNRKLAATMNATDPDLGAFVRRGGKLILWNGWDDPAVPAMLTLEYYQRVMQTIGDTAAGRSVRLFLVPGMGHGAVGPGFTQFGQSDVGSGNPERSLGAALQRWVETGVAPDQVIAVRYEIPADVTTRVMRARPLCAWPRVARHRGAGSVDEAASYSCDLP